MLMVILVGGVQHRLACLAHEAAHFTLLKSRFWNDFVADLLACFPIFATQQAYRVHHIGHHRYPNDWERDPNLINGGQTKHFNEFPMGSRKFIRLYYLRFFWPPYLIRHLWNIVYVNSLGGGLSPVPIGRDRRNPRKLIFGFRPATALAVLYLLSLVILLKMGNARQEALFFGAALAIVPLAVATVLLLPERAFIAPPTNSPYSLRFAVLFRILFYTIALWSVAEFRLFTGIDGGFYVWLFWILPVLTTFPYFMLLREIYQHANADSGELTNSRVFMADWFTRWAIFTYGQDVHLVHHMYPNVPHYNLLPLHQDLKAKSSLYADNVVEVHGTFRSRDEYPSIVDVMSAEDMEPFLRAHRTAG